MWLPCAPSSLMKDFFKETRKHCLCNPRAFRRRVSKPPILTSSFYRQETEAQRGRRLFLSGGLERSNNSRAGRLRTMELSRL